MTDNTTTVLFAVRHGETEWNHIGRQQGHLDSPLSESGIKQAHALANGLRGKGIEVIYSSDLGRAVQTAEIIGAKLDLRINFDPRLRERHLGSMQGMTRTAFREQFPKESVKLESGNPDYILPGGESARQRFDRCIGCCIDLATRHPGGRVLLIAHGGVLNSMVRFALRIPLADPRSFSLFNAAINIFSVDSNGWRLDTWGEISHLGGTDTFDDH